jgi:hypothetical protein
MKVTLTSLKTAWFCPYCTGRKKIPVWACRRQYAAASRVQTGKTEGEQPPGREKEKEKRKEGKKAGSPDKSQAREGAPQPDKAGKACVFILV